MTAPIEHRSHEAVAHRGQYGDRSLWTARCGCGWVRPADSKQEAERKASLHPIERLAASLTCPCWNREVGEFDPELYPCAVDELKELLGKAAA